LQNKPKNFIMQNFHFIFSIMRQLLYLHGSKKNEPEIAIFF
jgi:hypothetical protein